MRTKHLKPTAKWRHPKISDLTEGTEVVCLHCTSVAGARPDLRYVYGKIKEVGRAKIFLAEDFETGKRLALTFPVESMNQVLIRRVKK